jgi:hypothetical protein
MFELACIVPNSNAYVLKVWYPFTLVPTPNAHRYLFDSILLLSLFRKEF